MSMCWKRVWSRGIKVDDPPEEMTVTFDGWLMAEPDHEFRNGDMVHSGSG